MNTLENLFDELVPSQGKADTVAGEIIRAFARIKYRCFNDGDHIGIGYGNETCNAAARYLDHHCEGAGDIIFDHMWGVYSDDAYDKGLEILESHIAGYIKNHHELKEKKNDVDMWDYFDKDEDQDDYEDDDEWEEW